MKYIFTIGIPLFVIFLQVFLKIVCGADFTTNLGITIGAIGLGQIFPYIAFENLLVSKIIHLKTNHEMTEKGFTVQYFFEQVNNIPNLDKIKAYAFSILLLSISIFMIIVVMSANEQPVIYRIGLGSLNCGISWLFILSK